MASRGPNMSTPELAVAMEMRARGMTIKQTAKALKRHPSTLALRLKKASPLQSPEILQNYRDDLKQKSVDTLSAALTRDGKDFDLYKAAPIALGVMKGIGEFKDEQVQGLTITISNAPRGLEPETIDVSPEPASTDEINREILPLCDDESQKETV